MTLRRLILGKFRVLLPLIAALYLGGESDAQKPQPPGPPQSPVVSMPFPMGVQRGTTLELNLTGTNLAEPVALWTSIPGAKAVIPTDNNNGKDNAKLKVNLEVPKDAPMGFHSLRLATTRGISNLRLFCVDDLPQVLKDGKNGSKATAQAVPIPCVVCGTMGAESSDYYKIAAQANQKISFEVLGRRLGSPFDPQISITDAKSQKEVAYSNDSPGLQTDPRVTHTFKEAGEYVIEIRDVMHRGGGDYVYRLRIGDFPCATTPVPMAAKRGSKVSVGFAGPNVENVPAVEVMAPADPLQDTVWVTPKGANGMAGWPVALALSDLDETVEQEPNDEPAKANRVPVPGAVTGRFQVKGDVDHYAIKLPKGRFIIEAQTLDLYSPTEVYMVLKSDKGADVTKTNPQQAPRIDYNNAADAEFILAVEHLHYWGGPAESYRITVTPYEPGFDVNLLADRVEVPQGAGAILGVQNVVRRDYTGPIEMTVVGHPGITGQTTFTLPGGPPQPNVSQALILLTAAADVPMGACPVKVQCKATINGKAVVTYASTKASVSTALGVLPFPPRNLNTQVMVGVTEKPPFTLAAKFDTPEATRGAPTTLTISAMRSPGFDEEIFLSPVGLPANVAPMLKNIPKGANEIKVQLTPAAAVPSGSYPISFTGRAKFMNKDYGVTAPPVPLVIAAPFDLKIEPEKVALDLGGKVKVKVIATRKGGYAGPITLQIRNLPAGVTPAAATIAQGQNEIEIEFAAAANAAVGDKADVNILGTAPAAGNQTNASPNFTVSVIKK
ncbi:MAG: hypothetical protein K2R98_29170 [Gemmataceae bacterium]|nr:hypothetical protein [Gemmataceae bacterium]